jgi:biopolymer transport protein ExbD
MLASRFGVESVLPLPLATGGSEYSGPPRLIDVAPETLSVNGVVTTDLVAAITPLTNAPTDMLILRGKDGATLQRLVAVTEELRAAGFTSVVLVE